MIIFRITILKIYDILYNNKQRKDNQNTTLSIKIISLMSLSLTKLRITIPSLTMLSITLVNITMSPILTDSYRNPLNAGACIVAKMQ